MSKNLQDQPTTTDQPDSFIAVISGAIKRFTWAGLVAVLNALYVTQSRTVNGHALSANVTISKGDVGLSAVTNDIQLKASDLDTDVTLGANSDSKVPSQRAVKAYANAAAAAAAAGVVSSAPATLDTLNELAAALGGDANFAASTATAIGLRAPLASPALTGNPTAPTQTAGNNSTSLATTAYADGAVATLNTTVSGALSGKAPTSHTHALSNLTQSGATTGQVITWNGTAWAPSTPSGGGGSAITTPAIAYVTSGGDDGTGAIGDPSKPFLTAQAAFSAARAAASNVCLHLGVGAFGDVAYSGANGGAFRLYLVGCGAGISSIGSINGTNLAYFTLSGNGRSCVTVGQVTATTVLLATHGNDGSGGLGGTYPTPGENGNNFQSVCTIQGIYCSSSISLSGGTGGTGGYGGGMPDGNSPFQGAGGGNGAPGPYIDVIDCDVTGNVNSIGGNGGVGGTGGADTDNLTTGGPGGGGGAAGSGGLVNIIRSHVGGFSSVPGSPGAGGAGGSGQSTGTDGSTGSVGAPGSISTMLSEADTGSLNMETTTFRVSWIAGSFVPG